MERATTAPWWSFATAGQIAFGRGVSQRLAEAVAHLGQRVVICTDAHLVNAGIVDPLAASLRTANGVDVLVYDQGRPEIGIRGVEQCVAAVVDFRPSVVVGLGGGSNLDLAKAVAVRVGSTDSSETWSGPAGVPSQGLPVVALPTTAGTGSEVTSIAVLTDEGRDVKVGFTSPAFLPAIALIDPLLALSCPPSVTAYAGMDALTHAIEAFTALRYDEYAPHALDAPGFVGKNPLSDVLALEAIRLIGAHICEAVEDGSNVDAREAMALGSLLAGMAFARAGTAIVHAMQYPLGAATKSAHGHGNALLLPAALRYNLLARPAEAALAARALGASGGSDADAGAQLPDLVADLAMAVGIVPGLTSLGVSEADLPAMANAASKIVRLTANNPRPVDEEALLSVLKDALHGPMSAR